MAADPGGHGAERFSRGMAAEVSGHYGRRRESPEMDKVKIKEALVVEGRYDKNTLSQLVDAPIFVTNGFGIF